MIDYVNNNIARKHFEYCNLSYKKLKYDDILMLINILIKNIKEANKKHELSNNMRLSNKRVIKYETNGELKHCYLFVNSDYFLRRECISFNDDGFIGFCGWADKETSAPIIKSFIEWCDHIKEVNQ